MPAKKNRGIISVQNKRYYNGKEVKPTKYYDSRMRSVMAGTVDGELITDANGKVIPFKQL